MQWKNTRFVIFLLQHTIIWTPPFFRMEFISNNAQHQAHVICRQGSCNHKNPRNKEELLRHSHWVKGNVAWTNWPISTLLRNTTNQPCNLGQHSATSPCAGESRRQCNINRKARWEETCYKWGPPNRGVRVWEENIDGRNKIEQNWILSILKKAKEGNLRN